MFDPIHAHLLLNHIPSLGSLFGLALLTYGLIKKNRSIERAALTTLVVVALVTIPAYLSGEEAEETVEHLAGTSEFYLEEHEEVAEGALWLMLSTGALALISLLTSLINKGPERLIKLITFGAAFASFIVMIFVGNHGGKIRHSELRDDNSVQKTEKPEQNRRHIDHDDD